MSVGLGDYNTCSWEVGGGWGCMREKGAERAKNRAHSKKPQHSKTVFCVVLFPLSVLSQAGL